MNIHDYIYSLPEKTLRIGLRTVVCVLLFLIGIRLIKVLTGMVVRALERLNAEPGVISFMESFLRVALFIILVILLLSGFGVSTASFVAVLGSAGVTIGLAMQGSLSNLAGGVLILLQKPFRVGDYIFEDAHKNEGVVQEIRIFYTKLKTSDGRIVILPNGELANTSIMNYTFYNDDNDKNVRVSNIRVGVSYDSDIEKAEEILTQIVRDEPLRDRNSSYAVRIVEYSESSIIFNLFCVFPLDDYNAGRGSIMAKIKPAFDKNDIRIPFPQVDIHMK